MIWPGQHNDSRRLDGVIKSHPEGEGSSPLSVLDQVQQGR